MAGEGTPHAPVPALPEARYGIKKTPWRRRGVIIAGAISVAATLAWSIVITVRTNSNPVRTDSISIAVDDVTRTQVTFHVTMEPGSRALCTLRVLNRRSEIVGQVDVMVGPSEQESFTVTREVQTSEGAESGGVKDCVPA